jgi:hypothetical protein
MVYATTGLLAQFQHTEQEESDDEPDEDLAVLPIPMLAVRQSCECPCLASTRSGGVVVVVVGLGLLRGATTLSRGVANEVLLVIRVETDNLRHCCYKLGS